MAKWKGIVGKSFTPDEFEDYCHSLKWSAWRPSFVVIHNTYAPTLKQRPDGLTKQHILNLENFFKGKGWSAGPHLFVDDKQIWVFTPLTTQGVHSPSWNTKAIGVEMLGDFETEDFNSGRGLLVQNNAVAAVASISAALGIDPDTMKLHKEDTKTSHKTCPGKTVNKESFIRSVEQLMEQRYPGEHFVD